MSLFTFDHIHLLSSNPQEAADWYCEMLGGTIEKNEVIRDAPSINVRLGSLQLIIRGKRSGEAPSTPNGIKHFDKFSSHNEWGMDHFAFIYNGDLKIYCEELRNKGVSFNVEPWEFLPGISICYAAAPDGVSIELIQAYES